MKKPLIIIDNKIPFIKGVLESVAEVNYVEGSQIDSSIVRNADAIITRTRTKCNAALLEGSSVRFIATATIGTDHIDTHYCDTHGIAWTNAAGCNSGSVYQYIAAVFAWMVRHQGAELEKLTLGVVGCGHVGSKIVRLGKLLGMNVLANDPPLQRTVGGDFVALDEVVSKADIVTLHTPLTRDGNDPTFHLISKHELEKMKPGALLINSSRGEVVDGDALLEALKTNKTGGAVLDVWEHEPAISSELLAKTMLATPHIAGYSADGKAIGTMMSIQSVSRFFNFPLQEWRPDGLPSPVHSTDIELDANNKSVNQLFADAVLHTYPIEEDDRRLRANTQQFEELRGNYPVRREFPAYSLHLLNASAETEQLFQKLGFNLSLYINK